MKLIAIPVALGLMLGAPELVFLCVAITVALYIVRDPGRLMEATFIGAMLAVGYFVG